MKKSSNSYLIDVPDITRARLNGHGYNYCPRCKNGKLFRDVNDIACFTCGWRESDYLSSRGSLVKFEVERGRHKVSSNAQ